MRSRGRNTSSASRRTTSLVTGPASQISGFSNAPPLLVNPGNKLHTVGDAVTLQLIGSDLYGQTRSRTALEGLPPGLTLTASTGFDLGHRDDAPGFTHVEVTAFDGVLTTSETFPWIVDGGPPTLTITSPTTQATYSTESSTIIIGGTASDELAIGTLTWANSRGGAGTANGTNAWTTPAIPLFAGTNVITITVRDAAGHSTAATLTVTSPGTAPPTISIGVPTAASSFTTSADRILMSGTATDGVGVTSVTWANNRGGSGAGHGNDFLVHRAGAAATGRKCDHGDGVESVRQQQERGADGHMEPGPGAHEPRTADRPAGCGTDTPGSRGARSRG